MSEQAAVFRLIKSAIKNLEQARAKEYQIESDRIAGERLASRHFPGYMPSDAAFEHDPLGGKIEGIVEQLKELL